MLLLFFFPTFPLLLQGVFCCTQFNFARKESGVNSAGRNVKLQLFIANFFLYLKGVDENRKKYDEIFKLKLGNGIYSSVFCNWISIIKYTQKNTTEYVCSCCSHHYTNIYFMGLLKTLYLVTNGSCIRSS